MNNKRYIAFLSITSKIKVREVEVSRTIWLNTCQIHPQLNYFFCYNFSSDKSIEWVGEILLPLFSKLSTFQLAIKMQMVTLIEHWDGLTAEQSDCFCVGK